MGNSTARHSPMWRETGPNGRYTAKMPTHGSRTPIVLVALMGLVLSMLLVLWLGGGTDPIEGLAWVVTSAVFAGGPAAVYLLAAVGYGGLLGRVVLCDIEPGPGRSAIEGGVGLGLMLTGSHLLGVLGVLSPVVAIGVCAIGVAALVRRVLTSPVPWLLPSVSWIAIPSVAVLIVAASCAPGRLWDSEFGGYDAMSYHLPIVQEWIAAGRIVPLEHNVYSYLPSSVESAFFHLAVMTSAPGPKMAGESWGLIAGDGWRVLSAQWLHAGLVIYAAWMVACATRVFCKRAGLDVGRQHLASGIAGGLTLATPWVVVVGSLAYNEMAVVALGASALAGAMVADLGSWKRGAIVGGLIGVACGAKPTAMFMLGPAVGAVMLACAPRRAWIGIVVAGVVAGGLMLSPWMVRNFLHGGNPVFPYASGVFGTAHWTVEQVERFAGAHHFDGSVLDRLRIGFWVNPASDAGARSVIRWRGVTNPQWGVLFYAALLATGLGLFMRCKDRTDQSCPRFVVGILAIGLGLQLMAWLGLTHIQSRFLLPCVVFAAPLVGVVCSGLGRVRIASVIGSVLVVFQMVLTVWIWGGQAGGYPTAGMIGGVRFWKGEPYMAEQQQEFPIASTNMIADGKLVYLLGGARPLYFRTPVLYHTTWDRSPLGEAIRANPDQPNLWVDQLYASGVRYILADFAELERLTKSGWYDPSVTVDGAMPWLDANAEPVAGWPNAGQLLYRLKGMVPETDPVDVGRRP